MSVEQIMERAKRARQAYRRMVRDLDARGEVTLAKKAIAAMDKMKLEGFAKGTHSPQEHDVVEHFGGVMIAKEDLPNYGLDPAVMYIMNEEQGYEPKGKFYGFPDGSLVMLKA